uniref:C-type lectin BPL-like n=1 Tax=Euleptes europaea TaxID=460621 RepID=UPI002540822E|nr:C-type lectin BPL-like [Euleptes europaea]
MGPGTLFSLFFCHLLWLACGNPVEIGEGSLPHEEEQEDLSFLLAEYKLLRNTACNPKWTSHGFYCYRYFNTPRSFRDAEEECQSYGRNFHLTSIASASDSVFLAKLLKEAENDMWIGLQNAENCSTWTWTDGTPYSSTIAPWDEGQPDQCGNGPVCVQLTQSSKYSKWDDEAAETIG